MIVNLTFFPLFRIGTGIGAAAGAIWTRAGHEFHTAWRFLTTRRHLLEMDDRMLKDIGISRAQADYIASRTAWWRHVR
jgi:uncharacterized protein YjiS (DUF1127 family)